MKLLYEKRIFKKRKIIYSKNYKKSSKLIIILHVFYPELIENIDEYLSNIQQPFDLLITTTEDKYNDIKEKIKNKNTIFAIFDNKGRDILPFLSILDLTNELGYSKILKIHTKKSTHRKDGREWGNKIYQSIFSETSNIDKCIKLLENINTGIIGPSGELMKLGVNYRANYKDIEHIIKRKYGNEIQKKIADINSDKYTFFAGSMFWMRTDVALTVRKAIIDSGLEFQRESGQIDGTLAHAVERLFTLIPILDKKNIYEITRNEILKVNSKKGIIPEWSDFRLD